MYPKARNANNMKLRISTLYDGRKRVEIGQYALCDLPKGMAKWIDEETNEDVYLLDYSFHLMHQELIFQLSFYSQE